MKRQLQENKLALIQAMEKIIGVNLFVQVGELNEIPILQVDNTAVRQLQLEKLKEVKKTRNQTLVNEKLQAITLAAKNKSGNLLALAVEAAEARASLGEISDAMEVIYGRFQATHHTISGIYSSEIKMDENFKHARTLSDQFAKLEGQKAKNHDRKIGTKMATIEVQRS